jgi:hypothetical protein
MAQVDGQAGAAKGGGRLQRERSAGTKDSCLFVTWHVSNRKKIQTIDFRQCAASNALKIAI